LLNLIIFISVIIQVSYVDSFSLENYYIPLNIFIFISLYFFIKKIDFEKINYNILIVLVSLPVLISVLMFNFSGVEGFFLNLYNLDKYPAFGRYGGVFGRDVNALGITGSIVLLLIITLSKCNKINFILSATLLFLAFYSVVLSGMRTGLLVIFTSLFLFQWKLKIINFKYLILIILFLVIFVISIYNFNSDIKDLMDYVLSRFSVESMIRGFDGGDNGGNLRVAIKYYHHTIGEREVNLKAVLFGVDSSLTYVDNFYVFTFVKYGLVPILFMILLISLVITQGVKNKDFMFLMIVLISLTLALKGLFVINNFYMFIMLFILFFWRCNENLNRSR